MSPTTWTIGQVARRYGIARGTLLHYDGIGLLCPRRRSAANYRLYEASDLARLEKIRHYRSAGLSLDAIAELLAREGEGLRATFEQRLFAINREIQQLREQQALILQLLQSDCGSFDSPLVDKSLWVALLRQAGLDASGMRRWHAAFERVAPLAHQAFLESLGIAAEEIAAIRDWSRLAAEQESAGAGACPQSA